MRRHPKVARISDEIANPGPVSCLRPIAPWRVVLMVGSGSGLDIEAGYQLRMRAPTWIRVVALNTETATDEVVDNLVWKLKEGLVAAVLAQPPANTWTAPCIIRTPSCPWGKAGSRCKQAEAADRASCS